mmetsp:Transcript_17090/g.47370  ORF Transcript_17090/g.47370 Transcript_17090/m.47370 type:complete len:204 (+) Transcript_17090:204-815(+)
MRPPQRRSCGGSSGSRRGPHVPRRKPASRTRATGCASCKTRWSSGRGCAPRTWPTCLRMDHPYLSTRAPSGALQAANMPILIPAPTTMKHPVLVLLPLPALIAAPLLVHPRTTPRALSGRTPHRICCTQPPGKPHTSTPACISAAAAALPTQVPTPSSSPPPIQQQQRLHWHGPPRQGQMQDWAWVQLLVQGLAGLATRRCLH